MLSPSLFAAALALVPLLSSGSDAFADFAAYQCLSEKSGAVTASAKNGWCDGYRATVNGKTTAVKFDFVGSGRLVASDDGRTVVMIQSYLHGGSDKSGNIVEYRGKKSIANPIAVYVYRDGKRIATHRIHQLLKRKKLASTSISHVNWVRSAPATISGDDFTITTSSYRTITFNTKTGAIEKEGDSVEWNRCDIIARGKLDLHASKLS